MTSSAGILMYRLRDGDIEVLLVHPGGPFWSRKDAGAWSIPKGLPEPDEELEAAARREFEEELGRPAKGTLHPLGSIRQAGGKVVTAFALEGDLDPARIEGGGLVTLEWPRGSGRVLSYPEVDRAGWFALRQARVKLLASQCPLLDRLETLLSP
ncbi:NUDIX hydrolase [Ancylobacter novellus DSM 506]|uniref:NUDIX hydrolase n=1 Tax=Ancylobacter novellus (strain ATCC 8093 / DSM 506 / JCM 20403 / CCM 1077 / IAM 12100 / NBRC 12443 / NCIMB 10456) TaxID=639283 RepID=D7AAZ3_ANCN5|nr:NUDIX domain-containing protein [Ancylobacter novellus]ADH91010.1 NUDIX hydrolase [Ancylobacter novellus DSM 506]